MVHFGRQLPSSHEPIGLCGSDGFGLPYVFLSKFNNLKDTPKADGFLARRFKMQSVLGTILDPAADKALMTTLTVTLAMRGLLPGVSLMMFSVISSHFF